MRKLREEKKLTRKQLAMQVGYSLSSVKMIETNNSLPSEEMLPKIAEALDTPIEDFRQAYQHPKSIHRTPPETSKRFLEGQRPFHRPGAPVTEFEKEYYRSNMRWKPDRFRQVP
jgi:transcriptional regulator with XRE-family HTH domain